MTINYNRLSINYPFEEAFPSPSHGWRRLAAIGALGACILTAHAAQATHTVTLALEEDRRPCASFRFAADKPIPFPIADGRLRIARHTGGWMVDRNGDGTLDAADLPAIRHPGTDDAFTVPLRCGTSIRPRTFHLSRADAEDITITSHQYMTAVVDGVRVRFLDLNHDGRIDLSGVDGVKQESSDMRPFWADPLPLTPLILLGDRWVQVTLDEDNDQLTWTPYAGPLAPVAVGLSVIPAGIPATDPCWRAKLVRNDLSAALFIAGPGVTHIPPGDYLISHDSYIAKLPSLPPKQEVRSGRVVLVGTARWIRLSNVEDPRSPPTMPLTVPADGLKIRRGLPDRLAMDAVTDGFGNILVSRLTLQDGHGGDWWPTLPDGQLTCLVQRSPAEEPQPVPFHMNMVYENAWCPIPAELLGDQTCIIMRLTCPDMPTIELVQSVAELPVQEPVLFPF